MKMRVIALAALAATVGFTACKKSKTDDNGTDTNTELATRVAAHTDDQSNFSTQMDDVDNDINSVIESNNAFGRVLQQPCNVTVSFDSTQQLRRVTLTFNGNNCAGTHARTGTIVVTQSINQRWSDSGAVLTQSINSLKITRIADNKSITINGTRSIRNVSGGRIGQLLAGGRNTIIHAITGNMGLRFDDSTTRQWNVARRRTFTRNGQAIILTVNGDHSAGGLTGIAEWGTTRFGTPFVSRIAVPLKMSSDCNFRLGEGTIEHTGIGATTTVTFGLNAQGNPTTCPGAGPYYLKAVWTNNNGISQTIIRPY